MSGSPPLAGTHAARPGSPWRLPGLLLILCLPLMQPVTAGAQSLQGLDAGQSNEPVEIEASEALEWHRDEKVYIARGDARIARGDLVLYADLVTAHYRDRSGSGTEIWQVEAEGDVRVTTPSETITGDRAVYDLDKAVVVMTGDNLRAASADETLTAKDSLEYWENRQIVVARGDAVVVQGEKRLQADLLTGYLDKAPGGDLELVRVEAEGNVRLSTESEFARGDKGTYNLKTEVATLEGAVKITRGENQLNGGYAEVNLKTGISRLLGGPEGGSRVRSLIIPSSTPEAKAQ